MRRLRSHGTRTRTSLLYAATCRTSLPAGNHWKSNRPGWWMSMPMEPWPSEQLRQVSSGRQSLEEYGISVPRSYQLYLALGRFRNALLLDEVARRPTPALEAFIYAHRLQGYRPAEPSVTARRPSLFDPATSTH